MRILVALFVVVGGCVESHSVKCENGDECPLGTVCAVVTIAGSGATQCVQQSQLDACQGLADATACDFFSAPGGCHDGVCLAASCGNHLIDPSELCDDGNKTSGDGCSADCSSDETCGNSVVDLIKREECDFGLDRRGHDGCSSDCVIERARWQALGSERPSSRRGSPLVYDSRRRRFVMFGGEHIDSISFVGHDQSDTSEWDGLRWHTPAAGVTPGRRSYHAMAYDAAHGQVIMFSGTDGATDTWAWNGTTWTLLQPAHHPSARTGSAMTYDAARKRIVLFGGYGTSGADTWTWDGSDWQELVGIPSPPVRYAYAMAYDPVRARTVVFGGYLPAAPFAPIAEVWEFDGATWTHPTASGGPSGRRDPAMAFDPTTNKMMIVGGTDQSQGYKDVWEWDGASWTSLGTAPSLDSYALRFHALATDPVRGRVVLRGTEGDLYEWNGTSWDTPPDAASLDPEPQPTAREAAAIAHDLRRHEVLMFGGSTNHQAANGAVGDTWIWNGAWRSPTVSGPPPARFSPAMVYDARRDETVMFGGCAQAPVIGLCSSVLFDTWIWKNHAWSHPIPATTPPARYAAAIAYDPVAQRVVMFGGEGSGGLAFDDTWTWDGSDWHLETTPTKPTFRFMATMGYDRSSSRIVLFGGATTSSGSADTWTWDGQTWANVTPSSSPIARVDTRMAWDGGRAHLVMVGGRAVGSDGSGEQSLEDAWEWYGGTWNLLPASGLSGGDGRFGHGLVPALDGAGVVVIGGSTATSTTNGPSFGDTWRLRWDGEGSYETCTGGDADGDGLSGCADPDCWWSCSPACPPATTCAVTASCGDGTCDALTEQCTTCPADCGACAAHCGDGTCSAGETQASCPGDCTP